MTNIAMENHHFQRVNPLNMANMAILTIAMLVITRGILSLDSWHHRLVDSPSDPITTSAGAMNFLRSCGVCGLVLGKGDGGGETHRTLEIKIGGFDPNLGVPPLELEDLHVAFGSKVNEPYHYFH